MAEGKPWAQLVSLTDLRSDPVLIKDDSFTFGRAKNCDMSFAGNKMVSGNHCRIERDRGGVWLHDSSTNGTLVNLHLKIQKNKHQLKHGDEIHIIYKKNEPDVNVGFVFQDLAELEKEDSSDQTLEYSSDLNEMDQTQEIEQDVKIDDSTAENKSTEADTKNPFTRKRTLDENENTQDDNSEKTDKDEPPAKIAKVPSLNTAAAKEGWGAGAKKAVATATCDDPYEDTLVCSICQDVFHDAVSLQPCMHSFCGGCYSDWMKRSRECPTCRKKVERISKNHLVNNMVEAYLKQNPDKVRHGDDIKELDQKNKITENMKFPTELCVENIDDDDDDDEFDGSGPFSDSDEDDVVELQPVFGGAPVIAMGGSQIYVPRTVCRLCPGYTGRIDHPAAFVPLAGTPTTATPTTTAMTSQSADDPGEGTSSGASGGRRSLPDVKVMADPPGYTCYDGQTHILCQCCLEPMPDLRRQYSEERADDPDVRPMQCKMCDRTYCHAFWGCRKSSCSGCIGKFKDLIFDTYFWRTIILSNATESAIMKQYAESKGMTMRDLLQECCERLDSKKYRFSIAVFNLNKITSNSAICYGCGQNLFSDLALQYRTEIPADELPDEAKNRSDCYWGKNCRTQVKPHHAQRYNHICEQTRH